MIRLLSPDELTQDFALNHLVIVGGAAWREVSKATPWFAQNIDIVLPIVRETGDAHIFECSAGEEKREFSSSGVVKTLTQDVGLIARVPHPSIIPEKTVTACSAALQAAVSTAPCSVSFTDSHVRNDNERYLQETFGNADAFCIVMNIPVANNTALPTNLWLDGVRLYEWSAETGPRW